MSDTLTSLAQRLNLLNLQLVSDSCGTLHNDLVFSSNVLAESQLEELTMAVTQMKERMTKYHTSMMAEMERLSAAKSTCHQILASLGKTQPIKAEIRTDPSLLPSILNVTDDEFNTVPKYMKGRLTRERVNGGVEFLNRVFSEKYTLLRQNPAKLSVEMRQRFYELRDNECDEVGSKVFITEADLKNALAATKGGGNSFKLDSTGRAILAILRHLGRMKEIRATGIVRFVINS